ncbi:MAG: Maf family protein [Spongiibacteraceae bacterium]
MSFPAIYLASQSPRRRELLAQIGVDYQVISAPVDESPRAGETPVDYVQRLAREKAAAGRSVLLQQKLPLRPVLGADTAVVLDALEENTGAPQILGKPNDLNEARTMLRLLRGRQHRVLTAVSLCGEQQFTALSATTVWFRAISDAEIDAYWNSGEPRDKAGAYGIQGYAAVFVERIDGSYSGVMGLPLFETAQLLAAFS